MPIGVGKVMIYSPFIAQYKGDTHIHTAKGEVLSFQFSVVERTVQSQRKVGG